MLLVHEGDEWTDVLNWVPIWKDQQEEFTPGYHQIALLEGSVLV